MEIILHPVKNIEIQQNDADNFAAPPLPPGRCNWQYQSAKMEISKLYLFLRFVCAWCPQRPEEGTAFPETGVSEDSCEPSCGYWELKPGPL